MSYTCDVTEGMPYFTGIPPHVRILSVIQGIWVGWEDLRYVVVSKMIEYLNLREILGGFNKSQMRDIFQGFQYEIMDDIGGEGREEEGGWGGRCKYWISS